MGFILCKWAHTQMSKEDKVSTSQNSGLGEQFIFLLDMYYNIVIYTYFDILSAANITYNRGITLLLTVS